MDGLEYTFACYHQVNNMLILTKKFYNISLEDVYMSKDFENKKKSKPHENGGAAP